MHLNWFQNNFTIPWHITFLEGFENFSHIIGLGRIFEDQSKDTLLKKQLKPSVLLLKEHLTISPLWKRYAHIEYWVLSING